MSSVMTSAVNPLALTRFSNERMTSEVRGLEIPKNSQWSAKGNIGERMRSPIKLKPSVAVRTVDRRHVFDRTGGCSTHDKRDANVGSCACSCEFTVCMENTLDTNRRNE